MTKRNSVGYIYFIVVLMTLLLRVSSSLDVYSALGVKNADAYFTCVVQLLIFGVLPLFLYSLGARRRGENINDVLCDFGVKKLSGRNWIRVVVIGVCMIVVASGVSYVWQTALTMIGYTRVPSSTDYANAGVLFRELLLVAVLPGVFEEIAHRGLLHAGYRECKYKFVIVSALLFSLMHQNITQTGYTFVDGIAMALAMYYTGSIWCGIFMHALNNAVSVLLGYISQHGGAFDFINRIQEWFYSSLAGLLTGALAVVICAGIAVLMFARMRKDAIADGRISELPFDKTEADVLPLRKDIPFILTVAVGVAATVFSFVWGVLR